jgi:hypothetical protein
MGSLKMLAFLGRKQRHSQKSTKMLAFCVGSVSDKKVFLALFSKISNIYIYFNTFFSLFQYLYNKIYLFCLFRVGKTNTENATTMHK